MKRGYSCCEETTDIPRRQMAERALKAGVKNGKERVTRQMSDVDLFLWAPSRECDSVFSGGVEIFCLCLCRRENRGPDKRGRSSRWSISKAFRHLESF
ncbi:hypothetical protein SCHPADRAFT_529870 [Schizopora paradoxa]|uniref:Uncharacterized protein n=1 Tax=Schizopora paradoxa TaxID=27342 RepID=A0A0H2RZI1_9AGAM|nr:hypothetical protein SCHPADRAFT_529870 [Schizopora paradoxa]